LSEKQLEVGDILSNAFSKGVSNLVPLLVNVLLWAVTVWIPYFNVGTTIGLFVGVIAKISKGEPLSMTEVFNPDYRKKMGNWFLVSAFVLMGVTFGMILFYIPGMVIALAWSFAGLLVVDKDMSAIDAIKTSNDVTYGHKWTMALGYIVIGLIVSIAVGLLVYLADIISAIDFLFYLIAFGVYLVGISAMICAQAYVYGKLTEG